MRSRYAPVLFLLFSAISAGAFTIEYRTATAAPTTPVIGLSLEAAQRRLLACADALAPPFAGLRPRPELDRLSAACSQTARRALARMPTHSLALFVLALDADRQGRFSARDRDLAKSVRLAAFEGWLAERRFSFAVQAGLAGRSLSAAAVENDIAVLLETQSGAELLALHLLRHPETRAPILSVAGMTSPANRQRLLNLIRLAGGSK